MSVDWHRPINSYVLQYSITTTILTNRPAIVTGPHLAPQSDTIQCLSSIKYLWWLLCLFPHLRALYVHHLDPTMRGLSAKIQSRHLQNLQHRNFRSQIVAAFHNSETFSNDSLLIAVPNDQATHNQFISTPSSPLYTEQDLPTLFDYPIDFDQLSFSLESLSLTPSDITLTLLEGNPITNSLQNIASITMTTPMPVFGKRATPVFNPSKPNKIVQYFNQLEDLFNRCVVATDAAKKMCVVTYVDVNTADTWEFLPKYRDITKTYLNLKNCLFKFYGQKNNKYIITDLDWLIGERQRIGVCTLQELTNFHLKFNAISTYLINTDHLSKQEQSQSYFRIFNPALQASVQMRLNIQHQAHHLSMLYEINKIYAAATWALQGTSNVMAITPPSHDAPQSASQLMDTRFVKTEQLGSILTELTKSFVKAIKLVLNTNTVMIGFMYMWCVHIFLFFSILFLFDTTNTCTIRVDYIVSDSWWLHCWASSNHVWLMVVHRPSSNSINTRLFLFSL